MDPITLTAIAVFLAPYLHKAGEKIVEKTVETLFDSRKDLAEKFKRLFDNEIITLRLSNSATPEDITKQLEAKPEVKQEIHKKVVDNPTLLNELVTALQVQDSGISLNAEKINIGQVINNPTGPITQNNTFS